MTLDDSSGYLILGHWTFYNNSSPWIIKDITKMISSLERFRKIRIGIVWFDVLEFESIVCYLISSIIKNVGKTLIRPP
jgi:hypothetical protein